MDPSSRLTRMPPITLAPRSSHECRPFRRARAQARRPLIAFALLVLGGLFLFNAVSARQAILFIVGGALGLTSTTPPSASPPPGGYSSANGAAPGCARRW